MNKLYEGHGLGDTDFPTGHDMLYQKGLLKGSRGETDRASLTGDLIPRLKEVRTFDLSLHESMECHPLVEGEVFRGIESRRTSLLSARECEGCETFMSNSNKDDLERLSRANLGRTVPQSLIFFFFLTGKGQVQKAFKQEFHLIGSVFQKEKFSVWIKESRKTMLDYLSKI